jgi:hypothetical protein
MGQTRCASGPLQLITLEVIQRFHVHPLSQWHATDVNIGPKTLKAVSNNLRKIRNVSRLVAAFHARERTLDMC